MNNFEEELKEFQESFDEETLQFFEHHPMIAKFKFRLWLYDKKVKENSGAEIKKTENQLKRIHQNI